MPLGNRSNGRSRRGAGTCRWLVGVAAALVVSVVVAAPASAQLTAPRCAIGQGAGDPSGCFPPAMFESSTFRAKAATTEQSKMTDCEITVESANPPADDGTGRVQLRVRNVGCVHPVDLTCDSPICTPKDLVGSTSARLIVVYLRTKVIKDGGVNSGRVYGEVINNCTPHENEHNCGGLLEAASDVKGLPGGAYIQESTIRLVLDEPGHPDPWESPAANFNEQPPDTNVPPEPFVQGICSGGTTVIRCTQRRAITVVNDNETRAALNCSRIPCGILP